MLLIARISGQCVLEEQCNSETVNSLKERRERKILIDQRDNR